MKGTGAFTKTMMAEELFAFFNAGVPSAHGGLRARAWFGREARDPEPSDEDLKRTTTNRIVAAALEKIDGRQRLVLFAYHSRVTPWDRVEAWRRWGGLVLYVNDHALDGADLSAYPQLVEQHRNAAWTETVHMHDSMEADDGSGRRMTSEAYTAETLNEYASKHRFSNDLGREMYRDMMAKVRALLKDAETAYVKARGNVIAHPKVRLPHRIEVGLAELAGYLSKSESSVRRDFDNDKLDGQRFELAGITIRISTRYQGSHRRIVLESSQPFPSKIGRPERRGRKPRSLTSS